MGTKVLQPSPTSKLLAPKAAAIKPAFTVPVNESQFKSFRTNTLLPLITPSLIKKLFHLVEFRFKDKSGTERRATIQVSEPVSVFVGGSYYYVPVTPPETFKFAKDCGAVPLTRAISDRAHMAAVKNSAYYARPMPGEGPQMDASRKEDIPDYVRWSAHLDKKYGPHRGQRLQSGLHKVWILSAEGSGNTGVNHGFHVDRKVLTSVPVTPSLDPPWSVIQNFNSEHGPEWWDYSQLLQVMKDLTVEGKKVDLLDAIEDGHPAVWDEGANRTIRKEQRTLIDPFGPAIRHAVTGASSGDPAQIVGAVTGLIGAFATPFVVTMPNSAGGSK